MPTYSLSVWLDPYTSSALRTLCEANERKKSDMVKVLIRKAARELTITARPAPTQDTQAAQPHQGVQHDSG